MHLTEVRIEGERLPTRGIYPFNIPLVGQATRLAFTRPVAFFLGENGSGKSTLLDAISRKCGMPIWDKPRRHLVHHNPHEARLADYLSVTWSNGPVPGSVFRAETFREFADFLDDVALCDPGRLPYHGGQLLNTLSHGEGFLAYFGGRFQLRGLYILDEPESALSPANQVRFLHLLRRLGTEGDAQFIIATHSPILLAHPAAQIFSFDGLRIEEVTYEETMHYQIYKQFFTDRSAILGMD
jgi:predicted ATPase